MHDYLCLVEASTVVRAEVRIILLNLFEYRPQGTMVSLLLENRPSRDLASATTYHDFLSRILLSVPMVVVFGAKTTR